MHQRLLATLALCLASALGLSESAVAARAHGRTRAHIGWGTQGHAARSGESARQRQQVKARSARGRAASARRGGSTRNGASLSPPTGRGAAPAGEAARSAFAFDNSVGVDVHLSYFDTAYGNFDAVRGRLSELGVKFVRDGACAGCTEQQNRLRALAALGIKSDLIIGALGNGTGTVAANLAEIAGPLAGTVAAIEGPNEADGQTGWNPALRAYQCGMYAAAKANPALRNIPVLAPSLISNGDRPTLGNLDGCSDFGNLHPYAGGAMPESNLPGELAASRTTTTKPVWITEIGYHTALASRDGQPPVSEAAEAAYVPRMFLNTFASGVARSFSYELVDEWGPGREGVDPEASFGLLRSDFSEKPAFVSLRNLLAILHDTADPAPGALSFTLPGANASVRHLLLRKSDGSYWLVLWRSVANFDTNARHDVPVPSIPVTVSLPAPVRSASVYAPVSSAAPAATYNGTSRVPLQLAAAPLVVKLG